MASTTQDQPVTQYSQSQHACSIATTARMQHSNHPTHAACIIITVTRRMGMFTILSFRLSFVCQHKHCKRTTGSGAVNAASVAASVIGAVNTVAHGIADAAAGRHWAAAGGWKHERTFFFLLTELTRGIRRCARRAWSPPPSTFWRKSMRVIVRSPLPS